LKEVVGHMDLPPEVSRGIDAMGGVKELAARLGRSGAFLAKARYHKALSDETRLRLLNALSVTDMCPCILKSMAGTGPSKLSYHLRILEDEKLIVVRRVKNWRIYSITAKGRRSLGSQGR
jgi:DNA-binding transcriptional ArsR family regulator